MELNNLIFPAPPSTYSSSTYKLQQIYIPRNILKPTRQQTVIKKQFKTCTVSISIESDDSKDIIFGKASGVSSIKLPQNEKENKDQLLDKIPCILIQFPLGSNKFLLYFHGNAEDVGASYEFASQLSYALKVNVIVVEYPGYGIYLGTPSSQQILKDSEIVFDYLTNCQGINPSDIIILGRSIGSGPATHIAAYRSPNSLIIMSGFTSLQAVVQSMIGKLPSFFIQERFKNLEKMPKIRCPICFLHGAADPLIPPSHAEDLMRAAINAPSYINISKEMTHNEFFFSNDVALPLQKFFESNKIKIVNKLFENIKLTKEIYEPAGNLNITFKQNNNKSLLKKIYNIVS